MIALKDLCREKYLYLLSSLLKEEQHPIKIDNHESSNDEDDELQEELQHLSLEPSQEDSSYPPYTQEELKQRLDLYHPYITRNIDILLAETGHDKTLTDGVKEIKHLEAVIKVNIITMSIIIMHCDSGIYCFCLFKGGIIPVSINMEL